MVNQDDDDGTCFVDNETSTMDVGTDNPVDVLEGEEIGPSEKRRKMVESEMDRQDSKVPLKDSAAVYEDISEVEIQDKDPDQLVCGIGSFRPRSLQWVAGGPKAFAFWSMLYLLVKTSSAVYLGSVVGTIEKQFKLSSVESGAILILNDAMDLILVIFVAYFGHKGHRTRIIAVGILMSGIGIAMCGIPHFMLAPYNSIPQGCNQTEKYIDYCEADENENSKDPSCEVDYSNEPAFNPVWWLIFGQLILGIGNVPVKPLGTTYIDDAVGKHTTPVYIAFLFIAISLGPLLGFLFGSTFLGIFVDFDRLPESEWPTFTDNDPRFIGAWWLGFVCLGGAVILISIPFFFFPKKMPQSKERLEEDRERAEKLLAKEEDGIQMKSIEDGTTNGYSGKEVETKEEKEDPMKLPLHITFWNALKKMFYSYKRMIMNLGLILLCLSSAMEGANAAANGSFSLKYYNVEFAVSPALSSMLAIVVFPFNLVGCMVGGYLIKRRKWAPEKCALFLLFGDVVSLVFVPVFLTFGCQTQTVAGISADYMPPPPFDMIPGSMQPITLEGSVEQANSPCNMDCTCGSEEYNPVCGSDGLTYASPCYAGCQSVNRTIKDDLNRTIYSFYDCRCIEESQLGNGTAVDGECKADCQDWHVPVLIVSSIVLIFASGLGQSGLVLITLRIVEDDMRSAALGFQTLFLNLFGYFPAPVFFGAAINSACILWGYENKERGACWVYDRGGIRLAFQGLIAIIKVASSFFFIGVYFAIRSKRRSDERKLSEKENGKP